MNCAWPAAGGAPHPCGASPTFGRSPASRESLIRVGVRGFFFLVEMQIFRRPAEPAARGWRLLGQGTDDHLPWASWRGGGGSPGRDPFVQSGCPEGLFPASLRTWNLSRAHTRARTHTDTCTLRSGCTSLKVIIIYYVWGNAPIPRDNCD